ncbi:unnamed protein product [Brachionus calyciflorus]|uniref:VWFA domain-containing protein n=1 Tax=Brachionus calyciflorus TaxID=104777 RepID=A0A814C106_9BILA|nr:unnamed protein product [Brachionus calyciflorus]
MNFASAFVYARKSKPFSSDNCLPEPDTNVISAKFDHLVDMYDAHTGEPIFCSQCNAVLSKQSKITSSNDSKKKIWLCEFCNFENKIFIDKEEIPTSEEATYILQSPHDSNETQENSDSNYLIYCIDISGSMSVTTQINADFVLPTDQLREETHRHMAGEFYPQYRSRVRHITRLESVQVAIDDNLTKLEKTNPDKKVGLVTFNQNVSILGDGLMTEIKMCRDLETKDDIKKIVERTPDFDSLKNTKKFLREKLLNLEEGGATALGPALYYSILLASRKSGSQVILCTDGLANKGIGSFENENEEETNLFYNELGDFAAAKGVSVSIITIEGTTCKLGLLGDISFKTGGIVNVVNPVNLKNEFSSILEDQIIATNVSATLTLHKALFIKDHSNFDNRQSVVSKEIGNVTKETEITFEFSVRDDFNITEKELPFQLKITYTTLNGAKLLRVLTKFKEITHDKNKAEAHSDRRILASNIVQSQGRLLQMNPEKVNIEKYSNYLNSIQPKNDDLFDLNAYGELENQISRTRDVTLSQQSALARPMYFSNAVTTLDDGDASKVYKLNRIKTKDLSRMSKK